MVGSSYVTCVRCLALPFPSQTQKPCTGVADSLVEALYHVSEGRGGCVCALMLIHVSAG
jgi:hypothetical protein